ncbi:hypothetical protein [Edaphobacillus lindanitolerans]|uniref:Uncharacterized protein n=1 Tax=Edaphobacillus lindanitolerans TaxID=550447 RepID=A0A1U7PLD8_9BACI|nr:hypothetical protein [Edaphobacillus lindanitolerans]SIT68390.1 hypothetical protein SAMN05428946_0360 [Edaphobacillus lindanitolerans]
MGKRAIGLAAVTGALLLWAAPAMAAPALEVKATGGLEGKAKEGAGFPLILEIHNSGDPFSGDLILDFPGGYETGTAEAVPVEVGSGETAVIRTEIDQADSYSLQEQEFRFFEGGWERGNELPYKGDHYPKLNFYFEDAQFLVALTKSSDRLSALKDVGIGSPSEKVFLLPLGDPGFTPPGEKTGWDSADIILLDESVLAGFTSGEQKALAGWVEEGGVLVIGATDDLSVEKELFSDRLPLDVSGRRDIPGDAFSGLVPEAVWPDSVPGFAAKAAPGARSLAGSDGQDLAAWLSFGSGKIVQTAFSLGDRPLSGTAGYPVLMDRLLANVPVSASGGNWMYASPDAGFFDIGKSVTERFETFEIPFPVVLGIMVLYIVLIGPVLYLILKKRDRREHAWWIIPVTSVAVSAALFAYGAKDRLFSPQLRQAALLIDEGTGSPSGKYVGSVLTNKGGDVVVHVPDGLSLTASGTPDPFFGTSGDSLRHAVSKQSADGTRLVLRDLPFWSVGTVYGDVRLEQKGSVGADLVTENGVLTGTITNGLGFRLKDVSVWSGAEFIPVGDLEAGESMEVKMKLPGGQLLPAISAGSAQSGGMAGTAKGYGESSDPRATGMAEAASLYLDGARPAIIGRTDSSVIPLEMSGKPKRTSVSIIVRPFEPDVRLSGNFTVPEAMLSTTLYPEEDPGLYYEEGPEREMYMEPGSYIFESRVPEAFRSAAGTWKAVSVEGGRGIGDIEILNVRTNSFEPVAGGKPGSGEAENFVSDDGTITLKFRKLPDADMAELPKIKVEGVAAR